MRQIYRLGGSAYEKPRKHAGSAAEQVRYFDLAILFVLMYHYMSIYKSQRQHHEKILKTPQHRLPVIHCNVCNGSPPPKICDPCHCAARRSASPDTNREWF